MENNPNEFDKFQLRHTTIVCLMLEFYELGLVVDVVAGGGVVGFLQKYIFSISMIINREFAFDGFCSEMEQISPNYST